MGFFFSPTSLQHHSERCMEDNSGSVCIVPVYVLWFMPWWWIRLNLCCPWGQAVNSPSKRHSYGRTYGISVGRTGPALFHPVQDVASKRHFFPPTELLLARVICGCVIDSWICEMGTGHAGSSSFYSINQRQRRNLNPCTFTRLLLYTYTSTKRQPESSLHE